MEDLVMVAVVGMFVGAILLARRARPRPPAPKEQARERAPSEPGRRSYDDELKQVLGELKDPPPLPPPTKPRPRIR